MITTGITALTSAHTLFVKAVAINSRYFTQLTITKIPKATPQPIKNLLIISHAPVERYSILCLLPFFYQPQKRLRILQRILAIRKTAIPITIRIGRPVDNKFTIPIAILAVTAPKFAAIIIAITAEITLS